jgi:hypothetical protein
MPNEIERLADRYSMEQQKSIKAALQDVATTRKRGELSLKAKLNILAALRKYPPDVVGLACDRYLEKSCATDGKDEKYLVGIARQMHKRLELKKEKRDAEHAAAAALDRDKHWEDGNRVYSREDLERWQEEVSTETNPDRLDPAKVSRVNRCMHERPHWDWV